MNYLNLTFLTLALLNSQANPEILSVISSESKIVMKTEAEKNAFGGRDESFKIMVNIMGTGLTPDRAETLKRALTGHSMKLMGATFLEIPESEKK
jgi:hypothetical protein